MTEDECRRCREPRAMLGLLQLKGYGRKLRLFAVACCRRFDDLLVDDRSRRAVQVSERFADGLASVAELHRDHANAWLALQSEAVTLGPLVSAARAAARSATADVY